MAPTRHETDPGPPGINQDLAPTPGRDDQGKHGGHGLMMMLMCVPMLLIAGLLAVTGAAGTGAVVAAVLCMAMMFMMPGGHSHT